MSLALLAMVLRDSKKMFVICEFVLKYIDSNRY